MRNLSLNILNTNRRVFLFCILLAVILRLPSFSISVMDHDESTYLIMGAEMLEGRELYSDITDTKPAGIFLIYAFMQLITGYSLFLKRLLVAFLVGASGYLIHRLSVALFKEKNPALAAGIIYILFTSTWEYFGISPNTELFFNFFTISGAILLLKPNKKWYFMAGILLGMGFMIKYLVLFDVLAIGGFLFISEHIQERRIFSLKIFKPYFLAGVGFSIPFGLAHLAFWLKGNYAEFHFITYELVGNYNDDASLKDYFIMLLDFAGRFLPVTILFFYVFFSGKAPFENWHKPFFAVWLASILLAIYLPGKGFTHYTMQLMVPLSLIAGMFYHPRMNPAPRMAALFKGRPAWVTGIGIVTVVMSINIYDNWFRTDYPREVAEYLEENMEPGETVYTGNYRHIIYYLLRQNSPTKYVHPTILTTDLGKAFRVNGLQEIKKILARNPSYVIIEKSYPALEKEIRAAYVTDTTFRNQQIRIFKRISKAMIQGRAK